MDPFMTFVFFLWRRPKPIWRRPKLTWLGRATRLRGLKSRSTSRPTRPSSKLWSRPALRPHRVAGRQSWYQSWFTATERVDFWPLRTPCLFFRSSFWGIVKVDRLWERVPFFLCIVDEVKNKFIWKQTMICAVVSFKDGFSGYENPNPAAAFRKSGFKIQILCWNVEFLGMWRKLWDLLLQSSTTAATEWHFFHEVFWRFTRIIIELNFFNGFSCFKHQQFA